MTYKCLAHTSTKPFMSLRLNNRVVLKPRLHDTTDCQTGCLTTVLNEQPLFVQPVVITVVLWTELGKGWQWRSRTFGRLVRWSNLPPCGLRFWKMDNLCKASRTNA